METHDIDYALAKRGASTLRNSPENRSEKPVSPQSSVSLLPQLRVVFVYPYISSVFAAMMKSFLCRPPIL